MNELILLLKKYKKEIDEYNRSLVPSDVVGQEIYEQFYATYRKKITLDGFLEWLAEGKGDTE